jgi:hypothetical protein
MRLWLITILVFLIISGTAGTLGYMYYKDSQQTIKELTEKAAQFEHADKVNQLAIQQLQETVVKQYEDYNVLQKKLKRSEEYKDRLTKVLRSQDLSALAKAQPGLIEGRINDATSEVLKDLESITGKQPTD